jgi:signal transduction histidine kinase
MSNNTFFEHLLHTVIDGSPLFIGVYDVASGLPICVNKAGWAMFGFSSFEQIVSHYANGKNLIQKTPEQLLAITLQLKTTGAYSERTHFMMYNGQSFEGWLDIKNAEINGKVYNVTRIADFSKVQSPIGKVSLESYLGQQQLEEMVSNRTAALLDTLAKLETSKEQLSQALAKEHKLNEQKSQFITAASHEFRTPLAVIQTSLSLLRRHTLRGNTDKQEQHTQAIEQQVQYLVTILDSILKLNFSDENATNQILSQLDMHQIALEAKKVVNQQ